MKARLLLTVSIASMLAVAPLSAKAACWVWKPCANGGMTESQGVLPQPDLPPLPSDGSVRESQRVLPPIPPDGSLPESQRVLAPLPPAGTASTAPAGAPQQLIPPTPAAEASPPAPAQVKAAPARTPTPGTVY
jgi:hypothetical protein